MAMEISNNYNSYASGYTNTTDNKKKETEKNSRTDERGVAKATAETGSNTTKRTAADELAYLSDKFSNYSFVAANYSKGMRYGSNSTTNVAIAPQFLAKMASDPELEKEYEENIAAMRKLDEEFVQREAAKGWRVVAQGWAIDKDGGISGWVITTKDPNAKSHLQTMSEKAEKIRKQSEEKKQEKAELEEKRQAAKEEKEELQGKMEETGKEQFGDKFKGVVVIAEDDENASVSKADKDNAGVTGLNMDLKA